MNEIDKLANNLEEPRAIRLLAEWLAIDHNETRLEYEKYMESASELYEYILYVIDMRHYNQEIQNIINCLKDAQRVHPYLTIGEVVTQQSGSPQSEDEMFARGI